ncbi:MAG: T9SS type A sorting domain-containing protein, partial [bacterium]
AAAVGLADPFNLTNPNFTPQAGSPALSGADFTNARLSGGFFTPTTFRGAFGDTRWDLGWANYNPLFSIYSILSDVKIRENTSIIPAAYTLDQNYPNPFNPSTQIRYGLPKAGHISLKIYDLTGREIATLVDQFQSAGAFTVTFDGKGLTTGVYFYRLRSESYSEVRRMLFVK